MASLNPFRSVITGDIDWGAVVLFATFLGALAATILCFHLMPPTPPCAERILLECVR